MSQCIDLQRIQETSDGDVEFEQELIEMYLEDANEHVQAIGQCISDGDVTQLSRAAHTLKGSSANIGAVKVQEAAYKLETTAHSGDLGAASGILTEIKEALTETDTAYKDYLSSAG